MSPAFDYGDVVRVIRTIRNDGTYPGMETGAQLVRAGSVGHVRNLGTFLQEQIIYAVHFIGEDRIVGCREEELVAIDAPWTVTRFLFRDRVVARLPLAVGGQVVVDKGALGEVVQRLADDPQAPSYHVQFGCRVFQLPESAVDPAPAPCGDSDQGA
jgi:nitrogen fixation protein NifZ